MNGETDLTLLLKHMNPLVNAGDYVFCTVSDGSHPAIKEAICFFREKEGSTIIVEKSFADSMQLTYSVVCSWITLTVHSSLEAVGLTSAVSTSLSNEGVSCNMIAAFYHDHIFVPKKDAAKAMEILLPFRKGN